MNATCDDYEIKIAAYADWRVLPHGIGSIYERHKDAGVRYKGQTSDEVRAEKFACIEELERQIFARSSLDPDDIKGESIEPLINRLKAYELNL